MSKVLANKDDLFQPVPSRIVYAYSHWQDSYDDMLKHDPKIEFTKNIDEILHDEHYFDKGVTNLLILDDLASTVNNSKEASDLFCRGVHHKNVSVFHICQNIFQQGKSMRNLHLNTHYYILFKNVRDINQVTTLARQTGMKHLPEAYRSVTSLPYTPLILDMKTDCPDYLRIRSHILEADGTAARVYVDEHDESLPSQCLRN